MKSFLSATSIKQDWQNSARDLLQQLGDIPIAGFYANGEIAGVQLYGYTGVLTVFV